MKSLDNKLTKFELAEMVLFETMALTSIQKSSETFARSSTSGTSHQACTIARLSNGRAKRAIARIKQILKSHGEIDLTKALTAYLDTLINDSLPYPAILFFNRMFNTRLGMAMTPGRSHLIKFCVRAPHAQPD